MAVLWMDISESAYDGTEHFFEASLASGTSSLESMDGILNVNDMLVSEDGCLISVVELRALANEVEDGSLSSFTTVGSYKTFKITCM